MSPKPAYPGQPRRGGSSISATAVVVLLIGIAGGALLLHAAGIMKIPFLTRNEAPKAIDRTGLERVPVSGRNIPAYTLIGREDVWDPKAGGPAVVWLKKADIGDDMITDMKEIFGYVLRRDKPAGYVFTKGDFYPKGTKPGPTAGVPVGMRALKLKAAQLPGLHGLKQGDRFDVVMSVRVELEEPDTGTAKRRDNPLKVEGPYAGLADGNATPSSPNPVAAAPRVTRQLAEVRVVVRNGVIVQPVHERKEMARTGGLLRGSGVTMIPVEEIVIAVAPNEVAALEEAMAIDAKLAVAMRSGQAGDGTVAEDEIKDRIVEFEPAPKSDDDGVGPRVRLIETIRGGKKVIQAIPEEDAPKPVEGASTGTASGDAK